MPCTCNYMRQERKSSFRFLKSSVEYVRREWSIMLIYWNTNSQKDIFYHEWSFKESALFLKVHFILTQGNKHWNNHKTILNNCTVRATKWRAHYHLFPPTTNSEVRTVTTLSLYKAKKTLVQNTPPPPCNTRDVPKHLITSNSWRVNSISLKVFSQWECHQL